MYPLRHECQRPEFDYHRRVATPHLCSWPCPWPSMSTTQKSDDLRDAAAGARLSKNDNVATRHAQPSDALMRINVDHTASSEHACVRKPCLAFTNKTYAEKVGRGCVCARQYPSSTQCRGAQAPLHVAALHSEGETKSSVSRHE